MGGFGDGGGEKKAQRLNVIFLEFRSRQLVSLPEANILQNIECIYSPHPTECLVHLFKMLIGLLLKAKNPIKVACK